MTFTSIDYDKFRALRVTHVATRFEELIADEANDPAVGKGVPVLSGVDLCGEPMTIGDSGKPTVVVFLAHYAGWPKAAKLNTEVEKLIARMSSDDDLP